MNKNLFIKSTLILILSGFLTKILGFIIKVIYTRIIGEYGISLFTIATPTYSLLLTISTLAIPISISKLVSENKGLGYAKNKAAAEAHAEVIAREYGAETLALHIDLTDTASLDAAAESLREHFGDPQILINNGGAEYIGLFQDMTDAELDRIMAADLTGAMKLTKQIGRAHV